MLNKNNFFIQLRFLGLSISPSFPPPTTPFEGRLRRETSKIKHSAKPLPAAGRDKTAVLSRYAGVL
jgi:hypothetical protein